MTPTKSIIAGISMGIAGLGLLFLVYKKYDKAIQSIKTIAAHK